MSAVLAPKRSGATFGPLLPEDSLIERIEAIWNLAPRQQNVPLFDDDSQDDEPPPRDADGGRYEI